MPEERKADALYIPSKLVEGSDAFDRAASINRIARPLLSLADGSPPIASPHEQDGSGSMFYFVRARMDDTKLFPKRHAREGEVRHDWVDGEDGIRLGYSRD